MQVDIFVIKELCEIILKAGRVPYVKSSPGMGKSSIARQIAEEFGLEFIDVRLADREPTDLLGMFAYTEDMSKATYVPFDVFPIVGDPIPEGKNGWLINFDEFPNAPQAVQKAALRVMLDHEVGQHKLHPRVLKMCCGNLSTDNAFVEDLSTAQQSRLIHLNAKSNAKKWIEIFAYNNDIDHRITSYLSWREDHINTFNPDKSEDEDTFACERTWEFASDILKIVDIDHPHALTLLAGTVGEGVAREFLAYTQIYKDLPQISEIIQDPENTKVPVDPGHKYAIAGAAAAQVTLQNVDKLARYIKRLGADFAITGFRAMIAKVPEVHGTPVIQEWQRDFIDEYA